MRMPKLPKLIESLRHYNLSTLISDLLAGITVGLVALPLAMAFAISSGVPPEAGIYTAVIAGFLISALGGSRTQIGGPTGAFVVIVYGIIAQHGINGLFICTIMAGVILIFLGLTGLGSVIKYMPRPVVIGFTNGIAVLIASTQIKDFFGLKIDKVPGEFIHRMEAIATHFHTMSWTSTLLASGVLCLIIVCMRFVKRIPGYIIAMVFATLIVVIFQLPVETIGTRFGGIPSGLPAFKLPEFHSDLIMPLMMPALTVALLGAIESLLSAVVADRMSGDKHYPNVELVAQGIANMVTPFFGGLPATGAIARTATNIRSGARTPVAGILHAVTLLMVLLFAAPLAKDIPLAALSAILLVVSYNMGEWKEIPKLLRMSWPTILVWLTTFALTVFADLTIAVQYGIIMAALLYIRKVSKTTSVSLVTSEYIDEGRKHSLQLQANPEYVSIINIHGPFMFGATEKLVNLIDEIKNLKVVVILRLRNMTAIDATGLLAMEDISDTLHARGHQLILASPRKQPAIMMKRAEFECHVGAKNVCQSYEEAIHRAYEIVNEMKANDTGAPCQTPSAN